MYANVKKETEFLVIRKGNKMKIILYKQGDKKINKTKIYQYFK